MNNVHKRIESCIRKKSTILNLNKCNLKHVPKNIPDHVHILWINDNKIKELPNNLPDSLVSIQCKNNELVRLPSKLPKNIRMIDCSGNKITSLPLSILTRVNNDLAFNGGTRKTYNNYRMWGVPQTNISLNYIKELYFEMNLYYTISIIRVKLDDFIGRSSNERFCLALENGIIVGIQRWYRRRKKIRKTVSTNYLYKYTNIPKDICFMISNYV